MIGTASNLTYSSLLAFVPILAVFFAVARGFGYSVYIETWFRDMLSSQPDAAETIIGFVNSYLVHTKKGIFLGIGLLFMLGTTLNLISNIESAFNDIWHVKHPRSIFRTVTDYVSLFFLLPIFLVVSSGLSIWVTALQDQLSDVIVLGPMMKVVIELAPYLLLSAGFVVSVCLYAQYQGQVQLSPLAGRPCGCVHADFPDGIYQLPDMDIQLQRHLRVIRHDTFLPPVVADIMDNMSHRSRADIQ